MDKLIPLLTVPPPGLADLHIPRHDNLESRPGGRLIG